METNPVLGRMAIEVRGDFSNKEHSQALQNLLNRCLERLPLSSFNYSGREERILVCGLREMSVQQAVVLVEAFLACMGPHVRVATLELNRPTGGGASRMVWGGEVNALALVQEALHRKGRRLIWGDVTALKAA